MKTLGRHAGRCDGRPRERDGCSIGALAKAGTMFLVTVVLPR
jgi:hypothetical protein